MKTSVLISGITAMCFLLTFSVAPRRHGEDKMNIASNDNISIVTLSRVTMLPGVVITADRKKTAGIAVPLIPAEDFTYLEFDVAAYMEADAITPAEDEVMPEAMETDYSYLKFTLDDYISGSELIGDEITELPENENSTTGISSTEPAADEFGYLRFDVSDYIKGTETAVIGELPLEESKSANRDGIAVPAETVIDFGYLKFDVEDYYPASLTDEQYELPEE